MKKRKQDNGQTPLQFHRVPCPYIECYNEQGEIVPNPAFEQLAKTKIDTPFRNLLPRKQCSIEPIAYSDTFAKYFPPLQQETSVTSTGGTLTVADIDRFLEMLKDEM